MNAVRRAFRWFGFVALACASWIASAQVALTGQLDKVDLWPQVRILADPARTIGLGEALAARGRFAEPYGAYATLGMDKEVVWLRVPIEVSAGGEGTWVLDIDYALLQRIDVYSLFHG